MFIPKLYRNENRAEMLDFIKANNFGILVSSQEGGRILATHIPFMIREDGSKLILTTHQSRANPQWKSWNDQTEVLVIFQGTHTYISSSWYDHINVPTWNYIAAHLYGKIKILNDEEAKTHLSELVDFHEAYESHPISTTKMGDEFVAHEMKGMVAFEIEVDSVFTAFKLSQNRDVKNLDSIIEELEKRGDENSQAIAKAMKQVRENKCPHEH